VVIIVLLFVLIGISAIMMLYGLDKLRNRKQSEETQNGLLSERQLQDELYHDVI
jgi:uncharacterized membrane protein YuzA (DUF378 family)